jgi:hypothetical protein
VGVGLPERFDVDDRPNGERELMMESMFDLVGRVVALRHGEIGSTKTGTATLS